jgi:WD40 repeat protein
MAVGDGTFEVLRNGSWTRLATIHLRHPHNVVVLIDPKDSREVSPPAEKKRLRRLARRLVPDFRQNPSSPGPLSQGHESWSSTSGPVGGELVLWIERHKRLSLIALDRGEERRVVELGPLTGVQSTALGPDGATLALGTEDHRVRVWHRRPSQRVISIEGHSPNEAWDVAFAPDGQTIASGGDDHMIRLWDAATGREKRVFRGHHALVTSVAFSPDGRSLASGSYDDGNRAMIWDLKSWAPRSWLREHRRRVRRMVFSPDGRLLASVGDDDFIVLWDPRDDRRIATIVVGHTPGPGHLAFSSDGGTIAATGGGHRFDFVDVATGRVRWIPMDEEVGPLIFSLDGSQLMIGMRDGSIRTWDMGENRQIRKVQGHAGLVLGLALSPDGAVLASAGEDGTVRVWDVATGQELLCLTDCRARVNSVAFSPDGLSLAAADHSGAVTIWDAHPRH